jgi:hypothetical protein
VALSIVSLENESLLIIGKGLRSRKSRHLGPWKFNTLLIIKILTNYVLKLEGQP